MASSQIEGRQPATTGGTIDPVSLLDPKVKAIRAKVIAYMISPPPIGRGYDDLEQVSARLHDLLTNCCQRLYTRGYVPSLVTVNYLHLMSWENIIVDEIEGGELTTEWHEYHNLCDWYKNPNLLPNSNGGPLSEQFRDFYDVQVLIKQEEEIAATGDAVEKLWKNLVETAGTKKKGKDKCEEDGDGVEGGGYFHNVFIGTCLERVFDATRVGRSLDKKAVFRLVVRIWTEGENNKGHVEAAEKWCRDHGYELSDLL